MTKLLIISVTIDDGLVEENTFIFNVGCKSIMHLLCFWHPNNEKVILFV